MVDLAPLIVTAQRLIEENGRSVTFIRHDQTLGDSDKPWQGPVDARASPDDSSVQNAVFINPGGAAKLGIGHIQSDLIMSSEQIMMVSPGSVDLTVFQEVLDDSIYWKITDIEVLKPGATVAIVYVGVKR